MIKKEKRMKKKILLIALTGLVCLTSCGAKSKELTLDNIPYDWPKESALAEELPLPDAERTEVVDDFEYMFAVDVYEDYDQYKKYVRKCKKAGYDIDVYEDENRYRAYRKDGVFLRTDYEEDESCYYIYLLKSYIKDNLEWPVCDLSMKLPKPEGTKGTVVENYSEKLRVHVGEMPEEKVLTYIDECKKLGFTEDAELINREFSAKHKDDSNLELNIEYGGVDTMIVTLEVEEDDD